MRMPISAEMCIRDSKYIKMALEEDINSEDVSTNAVMPEYKKGDVQSVSYTHLLNWI